MNTEDIVTIICGDQADANAEKIRWDTALAGQNVDIVVREIKDLPIMAPISCGAKPVIFSIKLSNTLQSAWVVTIQKQ